MLDADVEDLLVHSSSQAWRDTSLCILDEEGLIVLLQESFSKNDSIINEALLIINTNLSESYVEFVKSDPHLLHSHRLQLQLYGGEAEDRAVVN